MATGLTASEEEILVDVPPHNRAHCVPFSDLSRPTSRHPSGVRIQSVSASRGHDIVGRMNTWGLVTMVGATEDL